jgi:nickel-dependent lactate racemase
MIGIGDKNRLLTEQEIREVIEKGIASCAVEGKRVLFIIPDTTRTAPMSLLFKLICQSVLNKVRQVDFLVALGTHAPLSEKDMLQHVGISKAEKESAYPSVRLFNHHWDKDENLTLLGKIPASEVLTLTGGLLNEDIPIQLNRLILDYDLLVVMGPVFPHEVVGFSGGNKYFFPGIAGPEIVHATHWLGALITNVKVNGTKDTPIRAVMNRAASMIPVEKRCFGFVSVHEGLKGIYFGIPEEAWSAAADLSSQVHIAYLDRRFKTVLGIAPCMYDELWTAGKVMYKLESIVEDGGELIIYAPHISEVSVTHGKNIDQVGYHIRDYFLKQWERFKDIPRAVLAHSTHVRGTGVFENGVESPRIQVTLATGIPEARCQLIQLGYRDPSSIRPEKWKDRENEGILVVPNAGETLYKLRE